MNWMRVVWLYFCVGLGSLLAEIHGTKNWKKYPAQAIIASSVTIILLWPVLVFGRLFLRWRK